MIARELTVIAIVIGGAAGCGDDRPDPEPITARSGSRLAVQWYRYTDGAMQAGTEHYDLVEHTACSAQVWQGTTRRCLPIADQALFVDDACDEVVGRQSSVNKPTHFIGYDRIAGVRVAIRLFRAGLPIEPPSAIYSLVEGTCGGPAITPDGGIYRQVVGEVDGNSLVALQRHQIGDDGLGVLVEDGDDGSRVPLALAAAVVGGPCVAERDAEGDLVCAPTAAAPPPVFTDPSCEAPAVVVASGVDVPAVVALTETGGCPSHHVVGDEVLGPIYVRRSDGCRLTFVGFNQRAFAVGGPAALPALERTIEAVPGRRLQRMILSAGSLRIVDPLLFDTATGAPCRRTKDANGVDRCVPAVLPAGSVAQWNPSCTGEVRVVEVPRQVCERPAFAAVTIGDEVGIHAIGAPVAAPVYRFDGVSCVPYQVADDRELYQLGPALAPDTFLGAIAFGER